MNEAGGPLRLEPAEIGRLRSAHYNATLTAVLPVHADLRILRVAPDERLPELQPGQFLSLGLGNWERRVEGVDEEAIDETHSRRLARRAYSVSCSLLDDAGQLRRVSEFPYLEFYVTLVRHGTKRPPSLTPRLFGLQAGDRLFVESHAAGKYTLDGVGIENDVFFFATGTGEAPHNAMIAELLSRRHRGKIISVVSVRYLRDAAYRALHEQLARQYTNYRYFVLTTRESRTDSPPVRLQEFVRSGDLERQSGSSLVPATAHAFLCGNPKMIGVEHGATASTAIAEPGSMLDLLYSRGFQAHGLGTHGSVHFERFW